MVRSLPTQNVQCTLLEEGMTYVCNRKSYMSWILLFWQKSSYRGDITASRVLREFKHCQDKLLLQWDTVLEYWVLFFLFSETEIYVSIQWSSTTPLRFGIQGYIHVLDFYAREDGEIICRDILSIIFYLYIHIFCDMAVKYWYYSLSLKKLQSFWAYKHLDIDTLL